MRLTRFTDYTLRMLIHVAAAPDGRSTIAQVARSFGISETHLVKVAHQLGKQGVLLTTRGRGGGLALALPAESINIADIVQGAEGPAVLAECFSKEGSCPLTGRCGLERAFAEATRAFYAVLGEYTLADLVSNRRVLETILRWDMPAFERSN
jgi:Rrf2 family transcriptional regulator, nitric oxide-sensitive transcriptional repressor